MVTLAGLYASFPSPPSDRLELGPLTFRFYGLMIALGVLAAVEIGRRRWQALGGQPDDIIELAKWAVPAGLIGTRIYHVMTDWKSYRGRWVETLYIWEGGLGIPGGLVLGVAVGVWYAKRQGWNINDLATAVIPGIPVAQAIGRLGNWFNQEIFGPPTDLPWGVEIDEQFRPAEHLEEPAFHPTFLYEGLWNLGLAGALIWADRKRLLKPGQMIPAWIFGYGVGRFVVEAVRRDAASLVLGVRVNHWVSGAAVILGLAWFWWAGQRADIAHATAPAPGPDLAPDSDLAPGSDLEPDSDLDLEPGPDLEPGSDLESGSDLEPDPASSASGSPDDHG